MNSYFATIKLRKKKIRNLNPYIVDAVKKSGIDVGMVVVKSCHTTAGIVAQEDEGGLLGHDLPELLDRLVPKDSYYHHDDMKKRHPRVKRGEPKNAEAHLKHTLAAHTSMIFFVRDRVVDFGEWLSVLFVDFDPSRKKSRKVDIAVFGE